MGFPPPPNLPAPGATAVSTPALAICPTLPLPAVNFTLGGGSVGSDGPLVSGGDVNASASFPPSPIKAVPCGFCLALPKFIFGFTLPTFNFPPKFPIPFLGLKLSCDLSNPVSVSAGLGFGAGRKSNHGKDADLMESP